VTETAQRSRGKTSDSSGFFRPFDPDYVALKHSGSANKTASLVEHHITRCATEELFLGSFLARKDEFATPCAVRSPVAPQRPAPRQTSFHVHSLTPPCISSDATHGDWQRSRGMLLITLLRRDVGSLFGKIIRSISFGRPVFELAACA
jgi:hypothetical protein